VALLVVVMVIALITAVVAEFAYNSSVELAAAANFRDELRAHYLLRSSANLSRLLFQIQRQIETMDPKRRMFGDLQIPHYAPYLIGAFAQEDEAEGLGSLLGVQTAGAKGLGLDTGTLDAEIQSQDGKLNLNCAGGTENDRERLFAELVMLFTPAQFNPLFERADDRGEHHDRVEVAQALIDWADPDEMRWEPGGGTAAEDYGYESLPDPYPIKNSYSDTPGEIDLVSGIDEDFIRTFGDTLTVWGGCKVNLNEADPLTLLTLFLLTAKDQEELQNPQRLYEVWLLAQFLYEMRVMLGGFTDLDDARGYIENPEALALLIPPMPDGTPADTMMLPQGIAIDRGKLNQHATTSKRRIWKVKATAEVGRVRRRLEAVWDMEKPSQTSASMGTWIYWREQ